MTITKNSLYQQLLYDLPVKYSDNILIYPVTMKDIITFQLLSQSLTVRKNSTFHGKEIIRMSYLDFLFYCSKHSEPEIQYQIPGLSQYYLYAVQLLHLCCRDAEIRVNQNTGRLYIGGELITPDIFDDLRRIIILQNDIDFDVDEFLNYDTEQRLRKAQKDLSGKEAGATIEDYIDSLVIAMHTTEDRVMRMTIRKFWRYIKRYNLHESYTIAKTGECSGMVSFKEPIKHWMCAIEEDKYKHLTTDETALRSKIG